MQFQDTTAEGHFLSAQQGACAESNCTVRDADVLKEGRSTPLALKWANVNNNTIKYLSSPVVTKKNKSGSRFKGNWV